MPVIDLKFTDPCFNASESFQRGSKNEYRQDRFFSSSQPVTHSPFTSVHRPLSRQPQGQTFQLLRPIPLHGICSTYFSGKFARYRSLSSGSKKQTLPYGCSWWHIQKYSGKCQQSSRLAHLCRFRPSADQQGTRSLQQRRFRCRSRRNCLCTRFLHNRSEFIDISLGAFPVNKSGSEVAYPVRPARQHSYIPPYQRWQITRCQYIRRTHSRTGQFLYHGSRLSGLCQVVSNRSIECLLRYQSKIKFQVLSNHSHQIDKSTGLRCDQTVKLAGFYSSQYYPGRLRRIKYFDTTTEKHLVFLTNNFSLPAHVIAELYRCRWQVELFFKWIKQHLRIKSFFGTSENAVKSQIWIAVSVYVTVAIIKKQLGIEASLYKMLQILSVTVFEKISLIQLFDESEYKVTSINMNKQLKLFD